MPTATWSRRPPPLQWDTALPRPIRHAGSLPIGVYCQFERVANAPEWSVARTVARSFLSVSLLQGVRLNDALNAVVQPDEKRPSDVMRARTRTLSKDGMPLEMFAPAEGLLGPITWVQEHLSELEGRAHSVPDFDAPCPSRATRLLPGVIGMKTKAQSAFKAILKMEPLKMSDAEIAALHISTHSPHGSMADMARVMGEMAGFKEGDARALGHWLRDRNARNEPNQRDPRRGRPSGASRREEMEFRYTQGAGRRGERVEQLRVRSRLIGAVRDALEGWGRGWLELPRGLESWDVLGDGADA